MLKSVIFIFPLLVCSSMGFKIKAIRSPKTAFPTSAFWDCEWQSLFYCDKSASNNTASIWRYDTKHHLFYGCRVPNEEPACFCFPLKGEKNKYVAGFGRCAYIIKWNGLSSVAHKLEPVFCLDDNYPTHIFGLASVDPTGRFYCGTLQKSICDQSYPATASLYCYDRVFGVQKLVDEVRASSGLTWNFEEKRFYYAKGCESVIRGYRWSPLTGRLSGMEVVYNVTDVTGSQRPIGLTMDRCGRLYAAKYLQGHIDVICPKRKELLHTIDLPADNVVSVAFGGARMDCLFALTGTIGASFNGTLDLASSPNEGIIYAIKSHTQGFCGAHCRL